MKYLILGMLLVLVIAAACKKAEPTSPETPGQNQPGILPDTAINGTPADDNTTQQIDKDVNDATKDIDNW